MRERFREWASQTTRVLRLVPWTLRLLYQSHRSATVGVSILTLLQGLVPVAQLWVTKLLVDQVVLLLGVEPGPVREAAVETALFYVGLEAATLAVGLLMGVARAHLHNILQEHFVYHVQLLVLAQSARLDVAAYEDSDYYDQLARAQQQAQYGPVELLESLLVVTQTVVSLLSVSAFAVLYRPWVLPLLVLTTLPSFWALLHFGQKRFYLYNRRTPDGRRAEYLSGLLTNDTFAKEVRVWDLTEYLMAQVRALRGRFKQENIDLSRSQTLVTLGGEMLSTFGYYLAYLAVVVEVIAQRLTIGDLTLYAGVFSRIQSLFEELLHASARVYEIQLFAEQLDIFLNLEPSIVAPALPKPLAAQNVALSIRDLSFVYPGTEQLVLDRLSFDIRPGECVALVGVNGAGKTTLVKCLLRLYDPSAGQILVNDCDLREVDPTTWRQRVGVIFQDYARYQLSARENIGFGNLAALSDMERIRQAAKRAGIDDVLTELPDGYDSLLGRRFEGGQELSLGQWQRVALARALMRDAAFLILDEPTAAMDPQAEYDLYRHFRELAQGRSTLFISHRFSTVRMADRILVLEDGRLIEEGNHEELMAADGRYAHLFKLQAESYQLAPDGAGADADPGAGPVEWVQQPSHANP